MWPGLVKEKWPCLKKLRELDQDENILVRFSEHFKHRKYVFLAFEMLDINIFDFMTE